MLGAGSQTDRSPPLEEDVPLAEPTPDPPTPEAEPTILSLEDRVRRLEDVIATLQLATPDWVEATRTARPPKEAVSTSLTAAPPTALIPDLAARPALLPRQHPWLLADIYIELRCIPRLFFDPRYHLSWHTMLLSPLLLLGVVLSKWMIGRIPLIGWVLDFILFPVLLYILFKVLSREATRYRQTSPDLPVSWRL